MQTQLGEKTRTTCPNFNENEHFLCLANEILNLPKTESPILQNHQAANTLLVFPATFFQPDTTHLFATLLLEHFRASFL